MIKKFIQDYLLKKLSSKNCLLVYDADLFYRELILEMESENIKVFDAAENTVIAREQALDYWVNEMPKSIDKKLIFYVPFAKKIDDDEKPTDPFIIFSAGGVVFPDEASDNYKQLCMAALPTKADKIEELFSYEKHPSFDTIDALEDGNTFPKLKSGLNASSDAEVLMAFLNPNEKQKEFLTKDKTWGAEFKQFMLSALGLKPQAKKFETLQKELWRATLYSEFVYDLPIDLPAKLKDVPMAKDSAKPLILATCDQLRNLKDAEEIYVNFANEISEDLGLAKLFTNEPNLGTINTFSFEDTTYFNHFKDELIGGNVDEALAIAKRSSKSIWSIYDDERRSAWQIGIKACYILLSTKTLAKEVEKCKNINDIIAWYAASGFKIDTLHRELEKEIQSLISLTENLKEVSVYARKAYLDFMDQVQKRFQHRITEDGIQEVSVIHNIDLFDQKIEPLVNSGKKTVYILADALRFELAEQLAIGLDRSGFERNLEPSFAFVPTVTKYGMAALMPNAKKNLQLKVEKNKLEPFLSDTHADTRASRIKYTNELFGDKAAWYWEKDIINEQYEEKDLLFVTTTEIDLAGENLPDNAQLLIEEAIKKILKASTKLKEAGYEEFVLVADHGFVLVDRFRAGNSVDKPQGEWVLEKCRCVAGRGNIDENHLALTSDDIGVVAEADQFLFLKNYATYERGKKYFHEGLSLQECITPFLSFKPKRKSHDEDIQVNLTYKGKSNGYITTRRPSLELACFGESLFGDPIDIFIEAIAEEKMVGSTANSEDVNSTTGYIELAPGQSIKFTLAMDEEFEGKFVVYAKSPSTGVILSELTLETDYL